MRYLFLFFLIYSCAVFSQEIPLSMKWNERAQMDYLTSKSDTFVHQGFFPWTGYSEKSDSVLIFEMLSVKYSYSSYFKDFGHHSFLQVKNKNFILHINPIMNFEFSNDSASHFSGNTRGILISGQLDKRFRFVSGMVENQAFFQPYVTDYVKKNSVVPGSGRSKVFKKYGYDFSNAFGYLTYNFNSKFQLLLGHTRQFVGYGYRSVLLSDNTLDYPTLRFSFTYRRIQYLASYSVFQSATTFDNLSGVHTRKFSSMQYLNYIVTPKWEIGLFENTIFQPMSLENNRPPEEFYSPVLFSDYLIYGLRNRKNVMLGFQSRYSLFPQLKIYGQYALDDYAHADDLLPSNKMALQLGMKLNEPLHIKNLFLLAELNYATAGTYGLSNEQETFSNSNEPIAHPLGNHFYEKVFLAHYSFKRLFLNISVNDAYYEANEKRLDLNDTLFVVSIKDLPHVFQYKVELGFTVHRPSRLQAIVGMQIRKQTAIPQTSYFYVALRTSFSNFYDDF